MGSEAKSKERKRVVMFLLNGKYASAVVYAPRLEDGAQPQILELCNQEYARDANIRIMPDAHAGAGCVIGTTMRIDDKVAPALVGVDIGCGMEAVKLAPDTQPDFAMLDAVIRRHVPAGFAIRSRPHHSAVEFLLADLRCAHLVDLDRARLAVGTLGGGNHFIEMNRGEDGAYWLVVHSGSRHAGLVVSEIYRRLADAYCAGAPESELLELFGTDERGHENAKRDRLIRFAKAVEKAEKCAERKNGRIAPRGLSYLEGQLMSFYMQDMEIMTRYAARNRNAIADEILTRMSWSEADRFGTVHNFISRSDNILRKGAVPALPGIRFLLPMNMRDGSLICVGKGNPEWNWSCAHGAGRAMSRGDAKRNLSLEEYRETMQGIYTTCVSQDTLDEAPSAYKPMEEILEAVRDTADIAERLAPVYNFKAGKE